MARSHLRLRAKLPYLNYMLDPQGMECYSCTVARKTIVVANYCMAQTHEIMRTCGFRRLSELALQVYPNVQYAELQVRRFGSFRPFSAQVYLEWTIYVSRVADIRQASSGSLDAVRAQNSLFIRVGAHIHIARGRWWWEGMSMACDWRKLRILLLEADPTLDCFVVKFQIRTQIGESSDVSIVEETGLSAAFGRLKRHTN
ncbi:hypothetical protein DFH06DRAFT_1147991 [Mycena polygramma]|nr:hypothetical protein DFH06DRAFT_1147991 [Mycena polygramma]